MNYELIIFYIFSVFIFIVAPGPVAMLVCKNATHSLKSAFLTIIGTNLSSLILIGVAVATILGVVTISPNLLDWLSFLGAFFILYLGVNGLILDIKNSDNASFTTQNDTKHYFLQGFLIAISNPKDIIFFTAFFPQFIGVTSEIKSSIFLLSILWIVLDFSLLLSYAAVMKTNFVAKFKRQISICGDIVLIAIALFAMVRFVFI